MTHTAFTRFASILCGLVSVYVALRAVPYALSLPRDVADDALRFGLILLTAGTGLLLLVSGPPGLRRTAESHGPNLLRIGAALAIVNFAAVTRLSDALPLWAALSIAGVAIVAFVLPAPAFRGVAGPPAMGLREISPLAGERLRIGPRWVRWTVTGTFLLPFMGGLVPILGMPTIPSPLWQAASLWGAGLGGLLVAGLFFLGFAAAVPAEARRGTMPVLALWSVLMLGLAAFGSWHLLARAVPTLAAAVWGREAAQTVTVLAIDPFKNRKGCRGEVTVSTESGRQDICSLRRSFLQSLSPGDVLEIAGRSTALGQTIDDVKRVGATRAN